MPAEDPPVSLIGRAPMGPTTSAKPRRSAAPESWPLSRGGSGSPIIADDAIPDMTSARPDRSVDAYIDTAVLDDSMVEKLIDLDNGGLFAELVGLFRGSVDKHLDDIDESVAEGDDRSVRNTAHAIGGESASIGATQVAALARELEGLTALDSPDLAPTLTAQLRRSVVLALVAMDQKIEHLENTAP